MGDPRGQTQTPPPAKPPLKEPPKGSREDKHKSGGQARRASREDKPGEQTGRTSREDKTGGEAGRTSREDKPGGQARRTSREDKPGGQAGRTNREDKVTRTWPNPGPVFYSSIIENPQRIRCWGKIGTALGRSKSALRAERAKWRCDNHVAITC